VITPGATTIILVDPTLPANIGAVARAMKNMGFSRLRLVHPSGVGSHLSDPSRRTSAGSEEILEAVQVHPSLAEALSDLQLVVGLTARRGKGRHPLLDPKGLVEYLKNHSPDMSLGIVFGREDRGLTNQELDLCNIIVTIRTAPEHTSLNLAQAVMIVCYELAQGISGHRTGLRTQKKQATSEELEGLFQHARQVLLRIGFLDPENPDRILRVLRRILGRATPDSRETTILRGILRKMDWYARRTKQNPDKASKYY